MFWQPLLLPVSSFEVDEFVTVGVSKLLKRVENWAKTASTSMLVSTSASTKCYSSNWTCARVVSPFWWRVVTYHLLTPSVKL